MDEGSSNRTVTISNVTITNGSSSFGAGIIVTEGELNLLNTTIRNSMATTGGGGLYNFEATVNLDNVTLKRSAQLSLRAFVPSSPVLLTSLPF